MGFIVGETGKNLYGITSVDMSTNTSLQLKAVPPSGEANTKTFTATIDASGFAAVTMEDGTSSGAVAANESMFYLLANVADLDEAGVWTIVPIWNDTASTKVIKGVAFTITVADDAYT